MFRLRDLVEETVAEQWDVYSRTLQYPELIPC